VGQAVSRALAALALTAATAAPGWLPVPAESEIVFSGIQIGQLFEGTLPAFSGAACFDPERPEGASGRFVFDLTRATTGVNERDEIMRAAEWLDTAEFPQATLTVTGAKKNGDNAYEASAVLSIKGKEKTLHIPFATTGEGNFLGAKGEVAFDRRDFGVGDGAWGETEEWVGYKISVRFQITAAKGRADCGG
jgi:polyisoprenoid-binding protein YceI